MDTWLLYRTAVVTQFICCMYLHLSISILCYFKLPLYISVGNIVKKNGDKFVWQNFFFFFFFPVPVIVSQSLIFFILWLVAGGLTYRLGTTGFNTNLWLQWATPWPATTVKGINNLIMSYIIIYIVTFTLIPQLHFADNILYLGRILNGVFVLLLS